jgi:hypothetical protein
MKSNEEDDENAGARDSASDASEVASGAGCAIVPKYASTDKVAAFLVTTLDEGPTAAISTNKKVVRDICRA